MKPITIRKRKPKEPVLSDADLAAELLKRTPMPSQDSAAYDEALGGDIRSIRLWRFSPSSCFHEAICRERSPVEKENQRMSFRAMPRDVRNSMYRRASSADSRC